MDKDYFINSGIPPPQPLHFESSMPIQWSSDQSNFVNPNSTIDQFSRFDSNWSSIAPSAATAAAAEAFAFRELIGKLGGGLSGNANDCSNLPSTAALASPAGSADPRFADRAAKFSSFGSRSFNGRAPQLGPSNAGSNLQRVSSTPSLKRNGSPPAVNGGASSNEESSVSQEIPTGERVSFNSRKRKAISRGKTKAAGDENSKRWKPTKNGENETKAEEEFKEGSNDEDDKNKTNQKPPEPPKDYIHVRARRGQATDSHSLAERVRREKISERMKLLEDLVPGCNKVTGKALMLDEIINYVQSLQRQVEFLSMKLSSVNPSLDFNVENLLSKDILPQQMHHLDSSLPPFYHHQNVQQQKLHGTNISRTHPLDANMDGFSEYLPQFPAFTEDDLHSIFQMGFVQSSVNFPVQNQASDMKVEL